MERFTQEELEALAPGAEVWTSYPFLGGDPNAEFVRRRLAGIERNSGYGAGWRIKFEPFPVCPTCRSRPYDEAEGRWLDAAWIRKPSPGEEAILPPPAGMAPGREEQIRYDLSRPLGRLIPVRGFGRSRSSGNSGEETTTG